MTTSFSLVSQLVPLRFHPVPLKSACMAMAGITKGADASFKGSAGPPERGAVAHGMVRKRPSTTSAWTAAFVIEERS